LFCAENRLVDKKGVEGEGGGFDEDAWKRRWRGRIKEEEREIWEVPSFGLGSWRDGTCLPLGHWAAHLSAEGWRGKGYHGGYKHLTVAPVCAGSKKPAQAYLSIFFSTYTFLAHMIGLWPITAVEVKPTATV
jgi:hypothetical protein